MTEVPRWYREQLMREKLGLDTPQAQLMDVATYKAAEQAIQEKLDEQEQAFRNQHLQQVKTFKDKLA